MSSKPNHMKIGVFVLVGMGLFLAALLAFGALRYFEPTKTFETCVPDEVDGLSLGSAVNYRGVTVGKVTFIGFSWNEYPQTSHGYVIVRFETWRSILPRSVGASLEKVLEDQISKGLRARVKGQGITGISVLSLEYVESALNPPVQIDWTPRELYVPAARSQFTRMLSSIEKSLRSFEKLDLSQLAQRVETVLASLDRLVNNVDKLDFERFGNDANGLMRDVQQTIRQLQGMMDEARSIMTKMNLDSMAKNADEFITDIRKTNSRLQQFLDRTDLELHTLLSEVDASALNETLGNARQATESLNELLRSLREYPAGALLGRPPPPARSVERPK